MVYLIIMPGYDCMTECHHYTLNIPSSTYSVASCTWWLAPSRAVSIIILYENKCVLSPYFACLCIVYITRLSVMTYDRPVG